MENVSKKYTRIFDQIIRKDTTCQIDVSGLAERPVLEKESPILKYDPEKEYGPKFVDKVICAPAMAEEGKISFIKAALADKNRNIFKYLYRQRCECVKTQKNIRDIFLEHFRKAEAAAVDRYEKYQYLEFVVRNELPGAYEEIMRFFESRPEPEDAYIRETGLPLYLIRLGREKEALELMEMFVQEQARGRIKSIIDGSLADRENVFALLGCSENEEIRSRSIALAFEYYNNITRGYTYNLSKFLKYTDLEQFKQSLRHWLEKYRTLDPGVYSHNNGYCSLLAGDGKLVAEEMGYSYWMQYLESKERWKDSNIQFEQAMLNIASAVMKGIENEADKEKVIRYVLSEHRFLKEGETLKDDIYFTQFVKVLLAADPDMTEREMEGWLPERYKQYGSWKYTYNRLRTAKEYKPKPLEEVIAAFEKNNLANNIQLDDYNKFLFDIGELHYLELLKRTGKTIWFDAEGGLFPLGYADLFENTFNPVFLSSGVDFISIAEERKLTDGLCKYKITISNGTRAYSFEFESRSDWYEVKPFIKAMNLALADAQSPLRLIQINTGDQTVLLGLFDPDDYIPAAKKLDIYSMAISHGDGLMKQGY